MCTQNEVRLNGSNIFIKCFYLQVCTYIIPQTFKLIQIQVLEY